MKSLGWVKTTQKILMAEVNKKGHEGKTPIQLAREQGHLEIVKILKKAGAADRTQVISNPF
jgi:ankyrin repeat protein